VLLKNDPKQPRKSATLDDKVRFISKRRKLKSNKRAAATAVASERWGKKSTSNFKCWCAAEIQLGHANKGDTISLSPAAAQ
jgi:hypothetical protein